MQNRREFLFVRHGQTDWNVRGLLQGRSDRPLTDKGVEQANEAAHLLRGESVGLIVSSPLARAVDTAEVISQRLNVPIQVDSDLIERSFGRYEGRPVLEIGQDLGAGSDKQSVSKSRAGLAIVTSNALPSDAETWEEISTRVLRATDHWLGKCSQKKVLFVSHFGVMTILYHHLCGVTKPAKNAIPYRFVPQGENWICQSDVSCLED